MVRAIDFSNYQNQQEYLQIPGLVQSNNFSLSNYGATGAFGDRCAGGYLAQYLNYWGLVLQLEAGETYRLSAVVKGSRKTDFSVILRDPSFPIIVEQVSPPVQISAIGASAPGVAYNSMEFTVVNSGSYQVLLKPQEVGGHTGQDYVRIDNFILEQCVFQAPPSVSFTTDVIDHTEGGSSQLCVAISRAPDEEVQALVNLPTGIEEHFPNLYPRLLTFPAGTDQAQCYTIQSTPNGIYDGLTTYTFQLSAVDTTLDVGQPDSLILVMEDDTDYSICAWAGPDHSICAGESVQLGAEYTDVDLQKLCDDEDFCYAWTPESAFTGNEVYELYPTVSPTETTEYILWITDGQGNLFSDTVKVDVLTDPAVQISPSNPSICQGSVTLTAGDLQPGLSYTWSTGETSESIDVSAPGTYSVTATSVSGCTGTTEVTVAQEFPDLSIEANSIVLCTASPSVTLTAQSDALNPVYAWSYNATTPPSVFSQAAQVTVTQAGTYYLAVQDQATGCVNLTEINIYQNPSLAISTSNSILCNGQSVDLSPAWLSFSAPNLHIPDSAATWQWSTGETSPVITVAEGGEYGVTATFPNGCTYTATRTVQATNLELEITADSLFACAEAPMDLLALVTDGDEPLKYAWNTGELTAQITVDTLGIYSVTVTDAYECEYVAEVEVEECPFSCEVQQFAGGYACGSDSTLLLEDDPRLLTQLEPGDSFWAGDFRVEVNSATGAGTFNGRGIIQVPYFEQAQINVWLENVRIDRSCKMIGGEVRVEGVGAKLLSDELADALNDLLETLDEVDNALQVIDQVLGTVGNVVNSSEQIDGLLSENWNILEGSGPLVDEYPYLPPGLQNDIDNAITCYLTNPRDTCIVRMGEVINELTQVINDMFKADFAIHFEPYAPQHYGFDSLIYPQMREDYGHLTVTNRDYFVGWKSIEVGATDSVVAIIPDHIDPDSLIFEDNRGNEIPWSGSGSEAVLSVPDYGAHEETSQIYPVQLRADSSGQVEKKYAGKLNVIAYERKEVEVVLVPVNGAGLEISTEELDVVEATLNYIYKPAVVNFLVEKVPELLVNEFDNELSSEAVIESLIDYNQEMRHIINDFEPRIDNDDRERYYLFLINGFEEQDVRGYMPIGRNFGFVAYENINILSRTIAHELGHGVFTLEHLSEEFPAINAGTTNNLMDNRGLGTQLVKHQWDRIHNPSSRFSTINSFSQNQAMLSDIETWIYSFFESTEVAPICSVDQKGIEIVGDGDYYLAILGTVSQLAMFSDAGYDLVSSPLSGHNNEKVVVFQASDNLIPEYYNPSSTIDNLGYATITMSIAQAFTPLEPRNGLGDMPLHNNLIFALGHEFAHHQVAFDQGTLLIPPQNRYSSEVSRQEPYAVKMENRIRKDIPVTPERTYYGDYYVYNKKAVAIETVDGYTGYILRNDPIYNSEYINELGGTLDRIEEFQSHLKVCINTQYLDAYRANLLDTIDDLSAIPLNERKSFILYLTN